MGMKGMAYTLFIDRLPLIVRIILALPVLDGIIYGLYRIAKGNLIIGIIWIFIGAVIGWIIDIFTLVTKGKVTFLT